VDHDSSSGFKHINLYILNRERARKKERKSIHSLSERRGEKENQKTKSQTKTNENLIFSVSKEHSRSLD
jgi:hypothetical protein